MKVTGLILLGNIILTFCFFAICQMIGKDKYNQYITPLRKEEYAFKNILPMGLFFLNILGYSYKSKYSMKLLRKIGFVYGLDYAIYYLQIHMACKVVYVVIFQLIVSFIGIAAESGYQYLISLIISPVFIFFICDRMIDEKGEKRANEIKRDFPDFVDKISLLLGAGLNVRQAFEKIALDVIKDGPLYVEVKKTMVDIQSGKSEIESYREFAEKLRIKEANRFAGIIVQNIKIGGSAMLKELNYLAEECRILRKLQSEKMAEEAQTKLVFPMILMFIAVLLVVMVPAVLTVKGI